MSAAPIDLSPELQNGVRAGAIGGGGIIARLLTESTPVKVAEFLCKAAAACLVTYFASPYLMEKIESVGQRSLAYALIGAGTPELVGFAIRIIKAKGEGIASKAEKAAGLGKRKKKGAKRARR